MLTLIGSMLRNILRQLFIWVSLFIIFYTSSPVFATVFIRAGASGNGSDWENALPNLPAILIRGETYYIASGNYPSYTVDDSVNGSLLISIKKANVQDHGCNSNCGWNDSYATGQAVFAAPFNIITSYVIFDGVVGSLSSSPDDYGFRIAMPTNCTVNNNNLIGIPPQGYSTTLTLSYITVSHVSMIHCGPSYDTFQNGIYSFPLSGSNITISHNYFLNGSNNMLIRKWSSSLIEYNYFAGNWSSAASHGQQISPANSSHDITLRNNIFKNSNTFVLGVHKDNNYNWDIYNNITIGGHLSGWIANTDISSQTLPSIIRWNVHNNTFVDVSIDMGGYGVFTVGPLTDEANDRSYFYNNLFYKTYRPTLDNTGYGTGALLHTYNAYFNTTGTYDNNEGGTAQVGTDDPFINSVSGNYHLKIRTNPGKILGTPFNIDLDGRTRGGDGIWDRGAYQFKKPSPPFLSVY